MYKERVRKEPFGVIKSCVDGGFLITNKAGKIINLEEYRPINVSHLNAPISVAIELTRACNLLCAHCYLDAGVKRADELTTNEIKNLLTRLKEWGVFFVFITGGEATLRSDFKEIIDYLFKIDLDFNVLTNGTLLSPQFLKRLNKNTPFVVSFDYISENKCREGQEKLSKPKESIIILLNQGFPVIAQATLRADNIDEIPLIYKWCALNNVRFEIMPVVLEGRANKDHLVEVNSNNLSKYKKIICARRDYLKKTCGQKDSYNKRKNICNPNYYYLIRQFIKSCDINSPGTFELYVASNGDIYPSTYYSADNRYILGNIFYEDISKIWHRGLSVFGNKNIHNLKCATCEIYSNNIFCDFQYFNLKLKSDMGCTCAASDFTKRTMILDNEESTR